MFHSRFPSHRTSVSCTIDCLVNESNPKPNRSSSGKKNVPRHLHLAPSRTLLKSLKDISIPLLVPLSPSIQQRGLSFLTCCLVSRSVAPVAMRQLEPLRARKWCAQTRSTPIGKHRKPRQLVPNKVILISFSRKL